MNLAYLRRYRLVYLASPYTRYVPGLDAACREVCIVAAELMRAGVYVFSPIAHSHTIAMLSGLDPVDEPFWADHDRPLQDACDAIVIVKMSGWHESAGIKGEFAQAVIRKQPIYYIDPDTLMVTRSEG